MSETLYQDAFERLHPQGYLKENDLEFSWCFYFWTFFNCFYLYVLQRNLFQNLRCCLLPQFQYHYSTFNNWIRYISVRFYKQHVYYINYWENVSFKLSGASDGCLDIRTMGQEAVFGIQHKAVYTCILILNLSNQIQWLTLTVTLWQTVNVCAHP